jgi:DNA-binding transcriptional LysR family regulator
MKSELFRLYRSNFFNMRISLDALQVLDAIDTRGSFAAAAAALHRVPSALTHAVKKLEDNLAVTLFVRQGRRAVLTPAGRLLLEEGRHLLNAAGELECRVQRVATGWENELRIAVESVLDLNALWPLIADFYKEMSGTRLRLSSEVLGGCWDALATRRADLAIGAPGDMPSGGGYRSRPLGSFAFVFAVAPQHPLARAREPIPAAEILKHRAVVISDTSRQLLARSAGLLTGQDTLVVPDFPAKLAAQVAGLGVGHLPLPLAVPAIAAGRLVAKRTREARPNPPLHVAWRSDHEGRAQEWFLDRLEDEALRARLLGAPAQKRATREAR